MSEKNESRLKSPARREVRTSIPGDCELASKYASLQVKRDGVIITINSEVEVVK